MPADNTKMRGLFRLKMESKGAKVTGWTPPEAGYKQTFQPIQQTHYQRINPLERKSKK